MPNLRVLPRLCANGPANMAADESLLATAVDSGLASIRFYTWSEPTLTLGYFQSAADRLQNPRLANLPWLRRWTGGSALVHHHEVTYALALPSGAPWHDSSESWLCRFHHIITAALARITVPTRSVVCGEEQKLGEFLCFLDQTAGDLLANSTKVVGSAQRRQRGAILQHGGILLAQSEFTPELPGLLESCGRSIEPDQVEALVLAELTRSTGWTLEPSNWTTEELARQQQLIHEKYSHPDWNHKR